MPCWVVTCPECKHTFTHTEIHPFLFELADREHFRVVPKPPGGERTCPNCKTETVFQPHCLFYREDAPGQPS
jgi:hypothetical protein